MTTHHVGNVNVSCGSCSGCAATLPDGGCEGTVTIYNDPLCVSLSATVDVDGVCTATDAGTFAGVRALKYTPVEVGAVCTPGAASGSVSLTQELTVCCP